MFTVFAVVLLLVFDYNDAIPGQKKICKVPNSDAGICIPLNNCKPLLEISKKKQKTDDEQTFFRQSVASCPSGSKIKVCCPHMSQWSHIAATPVHYPAMSHIPSMPQVPATPIKPSDPNGDFDNRVNVPLPLAVPGSENITEFNTWTLTAQISDSCGVDASSATRIVGGNATEIDEYPWLALLEYGPDDFRCGGSLISHRHVLTAAHCLYVKPKKVRLSEYNITSFPTDVVEVNGGGKDNITVTVIDIVWAVQHPEHEKQSSIHDIGLIKLAENVEYSDFIKPICLPTMDFRAKFTVATQFTVAGWGSDNKLEMSDVKRAVYVPYFPMDICNEITSMNNVKTTGHLICAGGDKGKDSCRGDSGGPLMYEQSPGANVMVVGIVSSGSPFCGAEGQPGVYTYVYNYVDWINRMMNGGVAPKT